MIKILAVGNILHCDDGIGVKVIRQIEPQIKQMNNDIEVIIGETDYIYCLDNINEDDFVIIIDSTYFAHPPGTVAIRTLESCDKFLSEIYSEDDMSLLKAIRVEKPQIKGYLIGIEVENVDYSLELSKTLSRKFDGICNKVLDDISLILKGEKLVQRV